MAEWLKAARSAWGNPMVPHEPLLTLAPADILRRPGEVAEWLKAARSAWGNPWFPHEPLSLPSPPADILRRPGEVAEWLKAAPC